MASVANKVLLTVDDVAAELSVSVIEIKRLISRNRLKATQISSGEWRITPEALSEYLTAGAKDLHLQDVDRDSELNPSGFDRSLTWRANKFEELIVAAVEATAPEDATLVQWFRELADSGVNRETIDRVLSWDGKPSEIANGRAPGSDVNGNSPTRFATYLDLFAVKVLRDQAAEEVRKLNPANNVLEALYFSPEQYETLVSLAYEAAAKRCLAFSKVVNFSAAKGVGIPEGRRVYFTLPLSRWLSPEAKSHFADIAF